MWLIVTRATRILTRLTRLLGDHSEILCSRGLRRRFVAIMTAGFALQAVDIAGAPSGQQADRQAVLVLASASSTRAVLDSYCVACHNIRTKTAGLMLDALDPAHVAQYAEAWEKVVQKLRGGVMPPLGLPRPDRATAAAVVSFLETALDRAASSRPNPGRTATFHRLNRTEYRNVIRDVLALENLDVATLLPADDASYGFDNIAAVLGFSPTLVERYLSAARKISRLAVGDPMMAPTSDTYRLPVDLAQDDRREELPFGTRGGMLIRRHFPVSGEYLIEAAYAPGLGTAAEEPHQLEVSVDGDRVRLFDLETKAARQYESESRSELQLRIPVNAGPHDIGDHIRQEDRCTGIRPSAAVSASPGCFVAGRLREPCGPVSRARHCQRSHHHHGSRRHAEPPAYFRMSPDHSR